MKPKVVWGKPYAQIYYKINLTGKSQLSGKSIFKVKAKGGATIKNAIKGLFELCAISDAKADLRYS